MQLVLHLLPVAVLWLMAWTLTLAALAINHSLQENYWGGAPATIVILLINSAKLYIPYLLALLCTLVVLFCQVKAPQYVQSVLIGALTFMLLYAFLAIMGLTSFFICACDAWQQW